MVDLNLVMPISYAELNQFEREDIAQALRQFKEARVKNKIPSHTYGGQTGLLITVSIKSNITLLGERNHERP